jgi:hypothetical protein
MLLELNRPEQALTEFQRTLESEPNRFRTLAGATKAARAAGNRAAMRQYARQLVRICVRADRPGRPELLEARASLSGAR